MDGTTQSFRKKIKNNSSVILHNTNIELSVAGGVSVFTLPCPKSRITYTWHSKKKKKKKANANISPSLLNKKKKKATKSAMQEHPTADHLG